MSNIIDLGPVTAYALARKHGFTGTEDEWLDSLKGSSVTDEQIGHAVDAYLESHPDATVPDGSVSEDKLAQDVKDKLSKLSEEKVSLPKDDSGTVNNGTNGQILQTNGDGTTEWVDKPKEGPALTVTNTASVGQTVKITAVDETGQPAEWEAVDMPEQVQADWHQNDNTAADYVKNRTHYTKMNTVLEYGVLSGFEGDGSGMSICFLPYALDIYEGLKVEVTWDNQVYQLTATQPFEGTTFIGNKIFLGGEDSGEPFYIYIGKLQGITYVGSTGTETSHEVGIVAESPVRIKPYFLPSNIAYLQNGFIPLNLVIPRDIDVFGEPIAVGGMESTLENPYRNKRTLNSLTLETFNAMLVGTVSLPSFVLAENTNIASVSAYKNDGYISVLWSSYATYGIQGYDLAGAKISIYNARIHEDADNPGTIVSEYAVINVANKRLT